MAEKMKIQDTRAKTDKELLSELANLKRERMNLRFQKSTGSRLNPLRSRQIKLSIAWINTVLSERKMSEN
jgi:large subunit ribosomal protein L29